MSTLLRVYLIFFNVCVHLNVFQSLKLHQDDRYDLDLAQSHQGRMDADKVYRSIRE